MSSVGSKDTGPEMTVRKMLHRLGYRYWLHKAGLPGSPDIVFSKRKKAIFVHGCFWHGHECKYGKLPKSKKDYWGPKVNANRERDSRNLSQLEESGWQVLIVWQCQLKDIDKARTNITKFLGPPKTV